MILAVRATRSRALGVFSRNKHITCKSGGVGAHQSRHLQAYSACNRYTQSSPLSQIHAPQIASLKMSSHNFGSVSKPYKHIEVETVPNDAVAIVRLTRPKALNALCEDLCREAMDCLFELDADKDIRCIILTGGGEKAFAAGADIGEMKSQTYADVCGKDLLSGWADMTKIRKPIIAAVNGYALGGGCELVMMCDIVLASEKAKFGQPEIHLGTIPGMGGSQRLTHCVGKSKAMEMILTGDHIDAQEAKRIGLVSQVYPHADLMNAALSMAKRIASFSHPAVVCAKEVVNRAFETTLQEGLLYERRIFQSTFANDDRLEGMTAFMEKRSPKWGHK